MLEQFIIARPSQECGCPEEVWLFDNIETTIHIEPNGFVHVLLDAGDWDDEQTLPNHRTIEEGRAAAKAWVASLPTEDELANKDGR